VSWGDEPGDAKTDALATMTRVRSKVDALDGRVLTAFEATQEHKAQGHASAIGWLEHNCRTHGDDAAGRRRLARRLRHQPLAEEALAAGEITARHVDVLERARRLVGDEPYRIGEQVLVDLAVTKRFDDFQRSVDYFIARARPADANEREEQQIRDRWCASSRTLDGCGKVDAWLPPHRSRCSMPSCGAWPNTSTARTSPRPVRGWAGTRCTPSWPAPAASATPMRWS
jgi:hypothetical protein